MTWSLTISTSFPKDEGVKGDLVSTCNKLKLTLRTYRQQAAPVKQERSYLRGIPFFHPPLEWTRAYKLENHNYNIVFHLLINIRLITKAAKDTRAFPWWANSSTFWLINEKKKDAFIHVYFKGKYGNVVVYLFKPNISEMKRSNPIHVNEQGLEISSICCYYTYQTSRSRADKLDTSFENWQTRHFFRRRFITVSRDG